MNGLMDLPEARQLFNRLTSQRASVNEERERLQRLGDGLDQMLSGLLQVHPELAQGDEDTPPPTPPVSRVAGSRTTAASVVQVVNEHPGDWLTVKQVVNTLSGRGWMPEGSDPESVIRVALRRAAAKGQVEKGSLDGRTTAYRSVRGHPENDPQDAEGSATGAEPSGEEGGDASGTDSVRVHDEGSSGEAIHRVHGHGAPVVGAPNGDQRPQRGELITF